MSISTDEVYNGLDNIDSLYYCGSACFLSLAAKVNALDSGNPVIRKLFDLSYFDAFLFSYSKVSNAERDPTQKECISKSLNYYKDVIEEISTLLANIEDHNLYQSIELDLHFVQNLQNGNESIFTPEDSDYPYDDAHIVSLGDAVYSSLFQKRDMHRLSLLCSLRMAYKLMYRKNMGKKPFRTFDADETLSSIESAIFSLESNSHENLDNLIDLIHHDLVLAEPEVRNATLKEDFVYLARSVKFEYDLLTGSVL